jgi:hypothetical protein
LSKADARKWSRVLHRQYLILRMIGVTVKHKGTFFHRGNVL